MTTTKDMIEQISFLTERHNDTGDSRYMAVIERLRELEAQLAALTHAIVERDLIIGQYIAEVYPPTAGEAT